METSLLTGLLWLYHAACILFSGGCLVLSGLFLVGAIVDTARYYFKKVARFPLVHLAKFIVALPAAFAYFYLYHFKGISLAAFHADMAKTMILLIVSMSFPLMLLAWINHLFEGEARHEDG